MGLLPLGPEALGRADGAVGGGLSAGGDDELDRLEEPGRAELLELRADLLVAQHLAHGLVQPLLAERRALALDDGERDAVHEDDNVGADLLLGSAHSVLAGDEELVPLGPVEVDELDRLPLLSGAHVLVEADAVGQGRVQLLVRLDEARSRHAGDGANGLVDVLRGQPRVQLLDGAGDALGQKGIFQALALILQLLSEDKLVSDFLQQGDRWPLGLVLLIPICWRCRTQAASCVVVSTRILPERRASSSADFILRRCE